MYSWKGILLTLFSVIFVAVCQENAQTRVPESLLECYQVPQLMQRDSRLPMTMTMLIDLIRKFENNPTGVNMDMRQLTKTIIHKYRLDGVVRASRITASPNVIPYSPKGFQFFKHRILLHKLLPADVQYFSNSTLTPIEKCTLHHMMSSTVEREARGDEGSICRRLSQYRTQRVPRQTRSRIPDVEIIDPVIVSKLNKRGLLQADVNDPKPPNDVNFDVSPGIYSTKSDTPQSECPVEDGVVRTNWGAVSVGPLLAGIAAGLEPQTVSLRDLSISTAGDLSSSADMNIKVDNRYAATLAGDLAEIALRQGPISKALNIGAPGGWNNTQAPRWYFLQQSEDFEMTDAEIRGGLDGLILAKRMNSILGRAPGMKLSQLLEMYYSQRGVLTEEVRACNRQSLLTEVAPTEVLLAETYAFSFALDQIMQLPGTISPDGFQEYATNAVKSLGGYIPSKLNDLSCSATALTAINNDVESSTDIIIVLDAMWSYNDINPSIAYLLDNLNISPLGSNVTMINAKDGNIIVNSTFSLATFHQVYNSTNQDNVPRGIDLPKILLSLRQLQTYKLGNESTSSWAGGRSSVVLVIAGMTTISESDINFSAEQLRILSEEVPDMRFFYLVSGSKDRFNNLVKDPTKDIFPLMVSSTDSSAAQINGVIKRIKEVPRRLTNHRCSANWVQTSTGSSVIDEYAAPQTINYYRLHPNYFYKLGSGSVKIQGSGFGPLTVCYSRSVELPRQSTSSGDSAVTCVPVNSNSVDISVGGLCSDSKFIHKCSPLYISVEALPGGDNTQQARCFENKCRYSDSIKYTVTMQDLGCYSSASNVLLSMSLLIASIIIALKSYVF